MKKLTALAFFVSFLTALSLRADVLFQDSSNYPYANGCIEGQGQWYCFYPTSPYLDAFVTNNVLLLNPTNHDEVGAPTNGWTNPVEYNFASFTLNVSQLPSSANGGYFAQLQNNSDSNDCCHIFIDTRDTVVPGTFRLGIANYATSFAALIPPVNYPMDLATGITYTVVCLFDANQENLTFVGGTLWINPSMQDYENVVNGDDIAPGIGEGFVYGIDTTASQNLLNIQISQIGFSPYASAGISNVIAGTTFQDVNQTNLPVFGVQPQSGTIYSGNSITLYSVASGVDLTYQWYSQTYGLLHDDNVNIIGSTSNILVLNNLQASDNYYAVVTDAYGNTATSATATNTVNTTPTAPFFTEAALNLTNNLFTTTGFTNPAEGTGPLFYQWYFAPMNTPNTFAPLVGQTSPVLSLNLSDYTFAGNYYVWASNAVAGGSIAYGPTNSITELAPVLATLQQLHSYLVATTNQLIANKTGSYYINTNNVTVSGYVTTYGGFGSTYSEFFIQDASGYGTEVFIGPGVGNTNTPPIGSYITVSAPVEVYHTGLELTTPTVSSVVTKVAPVIPLTPKLENANFNDFAINGLGTNSLNAIGSLVTFTNVYIYGSRTGGAIGNGGNFYSNSYSSSLYFTVGAPYSNPGNTNTIEIYQFAYNYGIAPNIVLNPIGGAPVPTHCYQLTGAYYSYNGSPEILPSRLADYVVNPPSPFTASATQTKGVPTVNWLAQPGSTYSVYGATNLNGPWTSQAYGLAYYPSNGVFTDTNKSTAKFYIISSP
ncbi:MAG: hypothetical protein WAO02_14150 [Verrucomicrobiia bacterium]